MTSNGYESIINNYNQVTNKLKIYIYDFHPPEFKSIKEFVHHTIKDKGFDWAETYKSWLYFMFFVMNSPMYTEDPNIADLFFVPQYEFVYRWKSFKRDYIEPLEKAIDSEYYKKSYPKRNHLIVYASDDTVLGDFRIPKDLKDAINERFFRISYSGRVYKFGKFHNNSVSDTMFDFNPEHEIVVPPGIPLNYCFRKSIKRYHDNDIMYVGSLKPINKFVERRDALKYMSHNFTIKDTDDSYFGIHCAGAGIWTARFYNYLTLGIIPICFSDGVRLPFETFFNYKSFSLKILSQTCDQNKQDFVEKIRSACAATPCSCACGTGSPMHAWRTRCWRRAACCQSKTPLTFSCNPRTLCSTTASLVCATLQSVCHAPPYPLQSPISSAYSPRATSSSARYRCAPPPSSMSTFAVECIWLTAA